METAFSDLRTARQLSTAFRLPFHRVDYAIQRLGIVETARVGIVRLYSTEQADLIRRAIDDIAGRRNPIMFQHKGEPCQRA